MAKVLNAAHRAAFCAAMLYCLTVAAPAAQAYDDSLFSLCAEAPGDFFDSEERLGFVWQELKRSLPQKQYATLLKEQRAWLKERDRTAGRVNELQAQCDAYARANRKRIVALERRLPAGAAAPAQAAAPAPLGLEAAPAPLGFGDAPASPSGGK